MVFSTLTFLYGFLPLVLLSYFLVKNRVWRNTVLLLFSLVFYAWGEPKYIVLMLAASAVAYIGGLLINRLDRPSSQRLRKAVFRITVGLLTANLLLFKYLNFFAENVNSLLDLNWVLPKIALPIGISFYTFQILSYVIDLYRREIGVQRNYFYLTLYVSFFPQLIAGPIVRYQTIETEIRQRQESLDDVVCGLRRFIIGLSKKVILANNAGIIAEAIYKGNAQIYGTLFYWLAAVAYALQIYFDFSGYSDMAIGLGRIFGFHFLENFRYPYAAQSITDFWRRWHISLSTWFRDYIYIPLGGNRCKRSRWIFNLFVVWALTGFWHGAQWNFVLWGLYYFFFLLLEKLWLGRITEKLPRLLRHAYALLVILVGWVIFNSSSLAQILQTLGVMFRPAATDLLAILSADSTVVHGLIYIPLGLLCMLPWKEKIRFSHKPWAELLANILCLGLFVICTTYILSSSYNPFIYFRF